MCLKYLEQATIQISIKESRKIFYKKNGYLHNNATKSMFAYKLRFIT